VGGGGTRNQGRQGNTILKHSSRPTGRGNNRSVPLILVWGSGAFSAGGEKRRKWDLLLTKEMVKRSRNQKGTTDRRLIYVGGEKKLMVGREKSVGGKTRNTNHSHPTNGKGRNATYNGKVGGGEGELAGVHEGGQRLSIWVRKPKGNNVRVGTEGHSTTKDGKGESQGKKSILLRIKECLRARGTGRLGRSSDRGKNIRSRMC